MPDLASIDLIAVDQSHNRFLVAFRLGVPEQVSPNEWRCRVSLDGLHDNLEVMHGADSMQALSLAMGLAVTLMREFIVRGGRLLYNEGEHGSVDEVEWPLESYFGWLGHGSPG